MTEKPKKLPPQPQVELKREDANSISAPEPRGSRTTLDVDPAWLEAPRQSLPDRPSLDRRTMDVQAEWLERESKDALPRSAVPPPLPVTPPDEDDVENEPVRSAIPPPLPPSK